MSDASQGGITVKVLTGRSAFGLQTYRDRVAQDQEAHLFAATRHCSHDTWTQVREWRAVREEHGTQGAKRVQKASYETVDPATELHASGQPGTHVREYTGNKWRKRLVRGGERATHLRIEPRELAPVKQSEAVHTIYAASAQVVDSDSHEDLERFFFAVKAHRDERCPGLQESMWLERNGKSGLAHVHVASNATIYEDFTVDGNDYKAGRKMAGALTRVDDVRAAFEQYLDAHPEHGLTQTLARVGTQAYADAQLRSGQRDYRETQRGKESNHDQIRRITFEALSAPGVDDSASFVAEMQTRGVEVAETGLRRGKPGKNHDYVYKLSTAKQAVRGGTLGVDYRHDAIGAQLSRKAAGLEIAQPAGPQTAATARPLPFEPKPWSAAEQQEYDELVAGVEAIAQQKRPARTVQARRLGQAALAITPVAAPVPAPAAAPRAVPQPTTYEEILAGLQADLDEREASLVASSLTASRTAAPTSPQPPEVMTEATTVAEASRRHEVAEAIEEPAQPTEAAVAQRPARTPAQATEQPLRSRLQGVKAKGGSPVVQARIDGVAKLEQDYKGRQTDAEFESRIKAVGGIGPQFLRDYGERMDPEFRSQLELRLRGVTATQAAYAEGQLHRRREEEAVVALKASSWPSDRKEATKAMSAHRSAFHKAAARNIKIGGLVNDGKYGVAAEHADDVTVHTTTSKRRPTASDDFRAAVEAVEQDSEGPSL